MTVSAAEQREPDKERERTTADPESIRQWALDFALRCWRQRVWWLPVVGPLVVVWISTGDPYSAIFPVSDMTMVLLAPTLMVMWLAFSWALWMVAAAERQMPAISPLLFPAVAVARLFMFWGAWCIVFGWIYVVLRFTATLEATSRSLGMDVDGGFLAAGWLALVAAAVCFGVAFAFRRPGCAVTRMLTETANQPPRPDQMLPVRQVLEGAGATLLSCVVGSLVSAFRLPAAGMLVTTALLILIALAAKERRQRRPTTTAVATGPARPVAWSPSDPSQKREIAWARAVVLWLSGCFFLLAVSTTNIAQAVTWLWVWLWVQALGQRSTTRPPDEPSSSPSPKWRGVKG